jgi:hypothetical protein
MGRREFVGLLIGLLALVLLALRLVWVQGLDLRGQAASAEASRLRVHGQAADRLQDGELLGRAVRVLHDQVLHDRLIHRDVTCSGTRPPSSGAASRTCARAT